MSDDEKVRLCAERIMGWTSKIQCPYLLFSGIEVWVDEEGCEKGPVHDCGIYNDEHDWTTEYDGWDPIDNDDHCFVLVDRMTDLAWAYDIGTYQHGIKATSVEFILGETWRGHGKANQAGIDGAARRLAIVDAALRACGIVV